MSTSLFCNTQLVNAPVTTVQAFLQDIGQLSRWNPALSVVTPTAQGVTIHRAGNALNHDEAITITTTPNHVVYHSQGDHLSYRLDFTLIAENQQTRIQEEFSSTDVPNVPIPLNLLALIAKHAFAQNLKTLGTLLQLTAGHH